MSADHSVKVPRFTMAAQGLGLAILAAAATALVVATTLAALGLMPWIAVPMDIAGEQIWISGRIVQISATILLTVLCVFLPSSLRILRLETSHRNFQVGMDDITRAYWLAHAADRAGTFELEREFDAIRERYLFLQNHPELAELENEVLEMAAKMSFESRELATHFSDEKVARAREMLAHRRADTERLNDKITEAHAAMREIRRSLEDVEMEEQVVQSQIARLREDFTELLGPIESASAKKMGRGRLRVATVDGE